MFFCNGSHRAIFLGMTLVQIFLKPAVKMALMSAFYMQQKWPEMAQTTQNDD